MIQKIASELVGQMVDEEIIGVRQRENYIYAYTVLGEKILTIGTVCILGIGLNNLINTLFFLIFFLALRKRTGGYHMDSFLKCYFGTIAIYLAVCFGSPFCAGYGYLLYGLLILSIFLISLIGTVNHPNLDMNQAELEESKKAARTVILIEGFVIFFLSFSGVNPVTISYMSMGVIVCALLLCVAKITGQEVKTGEESQHEDA